MKQKTEQIAKVFILLNPAKCTKMSDAGKILMWKILRVLKPIANSFVEDVKEAKQRLIPYEGYQAELQKAAKYETARNNGEEIQGYSEEEYLKLLIAHNLYNALVKEATRELADLEVEIDFELLSEDDFDKLCLSNDWTFALVEEVRPLVCKQ